MNSGLSRPVVAARKNKEREKLAMRLTADQIEAIKQETEIFFGIGAQLWLFGSRVDDTKKGGDIDLFLRPTVNDVSQLAKARFAFLARLKQRIGGQKIDLVLQRAGGEELPIHELARQHGMKL